MFGLIFRNDAQQRLNTGQPAQSTTGVAIASWSQCASPRGIAWPRSRPSRWSPITQTSSGSESAALTQKRQVMSRSSSLGRSSTLTTLGSSAMPQIGQSPGPTCSISGCIGQV